MFTPTDTGGFGMIDVIQLDKSIKLKAWGRFGDSKHPFFVKIRNKMMVNK